MVVANAVLQGLDKARVGDVVQMGLEILFLDIQEPIAVVIRAAVGEEVVSSKSALPP